jgi:hypothetical protein
MIFKKKRMTLRQIRLQITGVMLHNLCVARAARDELTKVKYLELLCEVSGMSKEEIFITND